MSTGWITRNSVKSNHISTIHSLSSLFNFNVSNDTSFNNLRLFTIGPKYLITANLIDSLYKKNIKVINFGIFDLGKSKPLSSFYSYPKNFVQQFFFFSTYQKIVDNTNRFSTNGLKYSYYPTQMQNDFIFTNMSDSLGLNPMPNSFVYAHLMMPHLPYMYNNEFKSKSGNKLNKYIDFWNFTNTKTKTLLSTLIAKNKYRIIFTGDHGFRGDYRVNPSLTFMAFYGFENHEIEKIETIQDLGSLINSCF
jgi:hypothetical protein